MDTTPPAETGREMEPFSLHSLAEEHLAAARTARHGRSAHTVVGGHGRVLRHLLMALVADQSLADHESPDEATLFVLRGRVRLGTAEERRDLAAGDMVVIPPRRHHLVALEDAVVLLTTAVAQA